MQEPEEQRLQRLMREVSQQQTEYERAKKMRLPVGSPLTDSSKRAFYREFKKVHHSSCALLSVRLLVAK